MNTILKPVKRRPNWKSRYHTAVTISGAFAASTIGLTVAMGVMHYQDAARIALLNEQLDLSKERIQQLEAEVKDTHTEAEWYHDRIRDLHRAEDERSAIKRAHEEFIKAEVKCLTDNLANEAGFEPENGQLAVGTVTMNRVAQSRGANTVCGVVYERHADYRTGKTVCMFSWTCRPRRAINPQLYSRLTKMAQAIYLKHERETEVEDATLYHAEYVHPDWADKVQLVAQIGQHLFYRP